MHNARDRTYAAALLFVAHVFAYADRQVVNVLLPAFRQSLDLTLVEASLLQGLAFSLFFALAGVPLGRVADRSNRRNLLAAGLAFWSLATVGCGLSGSFWQLFLARMCVGVGEACLIPASASLLADYYAPDKRGRAVTFVQTGAPLGSVLAMVGGGWLLTALTGADVLGRLGLSLESWQAVFLTLGGPGLILAVLLLGMKEPPRRESVASAAPDAGGVLLLISRHPGAFLGLIALHALMAMENYMLAGWAPTILMTAHGLSAGAAGSIMGVLMLTCGFGGYVLSGVSSDLLMRWRPRYGRLLAPGIALPLTMLGFAWLYVARDVVSATAALAVALFWGALVSAGAVPTLQPLVPNHLRGRTIAVLFLITNLVGMGAGPTLVAFVAEQNGGVGRALQQSLAAVCLVTVGAALLIWPLLLRAYAPARNYEAEEFAAAIPAPQRVS